MPDETTFNPVERMLKRKLDRGETLRQDEWDDWYEYHPELKPEEIVIEDDLVPEIDLAPRLEDDLQPVLDGIDILDAYARWSGKNFTPTVGSKRESIMIRCPNPAHNDANPSAWINLDKQTWYCGACAIGDDKYGIAAYHFDHPVPDYRTNGFPELRKRMVEELGHFTRRDGAGKYALAPSPEPIEEDPEITTPRPVLTVVEDDTPIEDNPPVGLIRLDWESLVESNTFLDYYMTAACEGNHLPQEFHFACGVQALGLAVGQNAYLVDDPNVYFNFLMIILGPQSQGKTRAVGKLEKLIQEVIPWKGTNSNPSSGAKFFRSPGTPQAMKEIFQHRISDTSGDTFHPIRGCQYTYELGHLINESRKYGTDWITPVQEFYDSTEGILTHKLRNKNESLTITRPFYSNIATTQPDNIHAYMRQEDAFSGFLSRWIVFSGTRRVAPIASSWSGDFTDAAESLQMIHAWSNTAVRALEMTADAKTLWDEFFHGKLFPFVEKTNDPILGRFELHFKKFKGIFAVNERSLVVEKSHVEKSIALWDYLLDNYQFFSDKIVRNELDECINKAITCVENYYRKHKKGMAARTIKQYLSSGKGAKFSTEQVVKAISYMEKLGYVAMNHEGKTDLYSPLTLSSKA